MRRLRHQQDLESRHIPNPSPTRTQDPRSRVLDINPAGGIPFANWNENLILLLTIERKTHLVDDKGKVVWISFLSTLFCFVEFLKYKMDKPSSSHGVLGGDAVGTSEPGVSGLLWVHLLAGRGLRSTTSSSAATTPSTPSGPPIGKQFITNMTGSVTTYVY
jgi:hypothetical protein